MLRLIQVALALMLLGAATLSARFGAADWMGRIPKLTSVQAAIRLDPWSSEWERYRCQLEQLDLSAPPACWEIAVQRDPRNARLLTEAALAAEIGGDLPLAEKYFRGATSVSAEWLPRWSIANHYARRGRNPEALHWLKLAFARAYGDLNPPLDLAEQAGASLQQIEREILCSSALCQGAFSGWLCRRTLNAEAAAAAARSISRYVEAVTRLGDVFPGSRQSPVVYVTRRLVEDGFATESRQVWRGACAAHLLTCPDPPDDGLITNGAFSVTPYGEGLDWRILRPRHVTVIHDPQVRTLKFALTGNQDEQLLLLDQWVTPLGRPWRVSFRYEMRGINSRQAAGFAWRLNDRPLAMKTPWSMHGEATGELWIQAEDLPKEHAAARFSLSYERAAGSTRPEGEFILREIRAEPAP
jgi:tetratricopeptide (TPR) repeat protein